MIFMAAQVVSAVPATYLGGMHDDAEIVVIIAPVTLLVAAASYQDDSASPQP